MAKIKLKHGICEIHKHALDDSDKREVHWDCIDKIWICDPCNGNIVLKAMGIINKRIVKTKN